jgi:hypothetical protein
MKSATIILTSILSLSLVLTSCSKDPIQEDLISLQQRPDGFSSMAEETVDHTNMTRENGAGLGSGQAEATPNGLATARQDGYTNPHIAEATPNGTTMTRVSTPIDEDNIIEIEPDGTVMTRPDGYETPLAPKKKKVPVPSSF